MKNEFILQVELATLPAHCPRPPDNMINKYIAPPPPNEIGRALAKLEVHLALLNSELYVPLQQQTLRNLLAGAGPRTDAKKEMKWLNPKEFAGRKTKGQKLQEKLDKRQRAEDLKMQADGAVFKPEKPAAFDENYKPDRGSNPSLPYLFANFQNITHARTADFFL